jgi:PAT family acetyl-CoA transporter-like MFS transporter 1
MKCFHFEIPHLKKQACILFEGFLVFWGVIFALSTTLVALFKHETDETYDLNEPHFGLIETYKILIKVLRLPSVRSAAMVLLTVKV